jgi:hypothetical protein
LVKTFLRQWKIVGGIIFYGALVTSKASKQFVLLLKSFFNPIATATVAAKSAEYAYVVSQL